MFVKKAEEKRRMCGGMMCMDMCCCMSGRCCTNMHRMLPIALGFPIEIKNS